MICTLVFVILELENYKRSVSTVGRARIERRKAQAGTRQARSIVACDHL